MTPAARAPIGGTGACRDQRPRSLHFDHAQSAHVHGRKAVEVAERRGVDADGQAGVEDRGTVRHLYRLAVDREFYGLVSHELLPGPRGWSLPTGWRWPRSG